jgi:hypothetical protein
MNKDRQGVCTLLLVVANSMLAGFRELLRLRKVFFNI